MKNVNSLLKKIRFIDILIIIVTSKFFLMILMKSPLVKKIMHRSNFKDFMNIVIKLTPEHKT